MNGAIWPTNDDWQARRRLDTSCIGRAQTPTPAAAEREQSGDILFFIKVIIGTLQLFRAEKFSLPHKNKTSL